MWVGAEAHALEILVLSMEKKNGRAGPSPDPHLLVSVSLASAFSGNSLPTNDS